MAETPGFYIGLDSSTQSVKATVLALSAEGSLSVDATFAVSYDRDLPHYGTNGGMRVAEEGARVTSPVLMWVEALDLLFERMRSGGVKFGEVLAMSGSGQQHGSVYWAKGAEDKLANLDPASPLAPQLRGAFAREESPIWADSSTSAQCKALEAALGGPEALAAASGSRAYERFTGNQIARIAQEEFETVYSKCERISLVSSFMCSLLLGRYAPVDTSDGSGTNLNELLSEGGRRWNAAALAATAPARDPEGGEGLRRRLGDSLVQAHEVLGPVSPYLQHRYGFSPSCLCAAWSGDNPCSLAGLGLLEAGDVAVSLGTSDTMFAVMGHARPGRDGHVLRNPVDPESFMGMLCFKNGSLMREEVRDRCAGGSWERFAELLQQRPPGNGGALGFYFGSPEITPTTGERSGVQRYGAEDQEVSSFDDATEVRAVIEARFLAMRHFAQSIGLDPRSLRRVIATGGASANACVLQVLADVFGTPVCTLEQPDSASLGAALRARHAHRCRVAAPRSFVPFREVLATASRVVDPKEAARPGPGAQEAYASLLARFGPLQQKFLDSLLQGGA